MSIEFCGFCMRETEWRAMRTGREQCTECKTVFPCRHACSHFDCADERTRLDITETTEQRAIDDGELVEQLNLFAEGQSK